MDIALLNERIVIQKNAVTIDDIGNHLNEWNNYFSCYATVSGSSGGGQAGSEKNEAGQTLDVSDLSFTVRYCASTGHVNVTDYRILFRGEIYDIIAIDYMNMKRKMIKYRCRKARR